MVPVSWGYKNQYTYQVSIGNRVESFLNSIGATTSNCDNAVIVRFDITYNSIQRNDTNTNTVNCDTRKAVHVTTIAVNPQMFFNLEA